MTNNVATLQGFTEGYFAQCASYDLFILVKPDADLDGRFKAWDTDAQEFIWINGWLWTFERDEAAENACEGILRKA